MSRESGTYMSLIPCSLHPGQHMELLRRFFWNRKSRAFYREAMGPFILSSRQKSTMSGIGIVVVVVDDRN